MGSVNRARPEKPCPNLSENRKGKITMYYIENYYTDEIIDTANDINTAITISKNNIDSIVTDENGNVYYSNIELPF